MLLKANNNAKVIDSPKLVEVFMILLSCKFF